jgi:hypothetical protein
MKSFQVFSILIAALVMVACSDKNNQEKATLDQSKEPSKKEKLLLQNNPEISNTPVPDLPLQEDSVKYSMGIIETGSSSYIMQETILMNDSLLSDKSEVILMPGQKVKIDFVCSNTNLYNKWVQPVYQVSLEKESKKVQGFLPQSCLAVSRKKLSDRTIFLFGLTDSKVNENDFAEIMGQVVVLDSTGKIVARKETKVIGGEIGEDGNSTYSHNITTSINSSKGLKEVINIIDVDMTYPACGYTNGNIIFLWDGKQVHYALQDFDISEAGLFASYTYPLFPSDKGGKEDKILSLTNIVGYSFEEENEEINETMHDSIVVQYNWKINEGVVVGDTIFKRSLLKK